MNLNDFFPYKVCINLDRRPDRWEKVRARFARHDIQQVERFAAFDWKTLSVPESWTDVRGGYGCTLSHLEVVREARRRRAPSVLIFEDDVVFADDLHEKFSRAVAQLPLHWDMIFFGGSHWQQPERFSENVFRVRATAATHAYALNQTIYDAFIELNSSARSMVDVNNTTLQSERECYCFMPHLAWQEADYSDVGERDINVWWMKDALVICSAEMKDVLRRTLVVLAHEGTVDDAPTTQRLDFILDHYLRLSPDIAVVVVEHGGRARIYAGASGRSYHQQFLNDACDTSDMERARRFRAGFEAFATGKDFFIFADSNVWISAGDIRANLMKCRDHDVVTSFRDVFDLDYADTDRLLRGGEVDISTYGPREWRGPYGDSCFYTRRGVETLACVEPSGNGAPLSIFESPNRAFRLHRAGVKEATQQ